MPRTGQAPVTAVPDAEPGGDHAQKDQPQDAANWLAAGCVLSRPSSCNPSCDPRFGVDATADEIHTEVEHHVKKPERQGRALNHCNIP